MRKSLKISSFNRMSSHILRDTLKKPAVTEIEFEIRRCRCLHTRWGRKMTTTPVDALSEFGGLEINFQRGRPKATHTTATEMLNINSGARPIRNSRLKRFNFVSRGSRLAGMDSRIHRIFVGGVSCQSEFLSWQRYSILLEYFTVV